MGRPGSQGCRDWDRKCKQGPQVLFYLETLEIAGLRGLRLEVCLSRTFPVFLAGLRSLWARYLLYPLRRWDRERPDWHSVCMSQSSCFVQTHVYLPPPFAPAYRTGWGNSTHDQASREGSTNPPEERRTTRGHPFPRRKVEYGSTQFRTCLGLV